MNPGIYDDIPNADYHGGEGISNSGLRIVREDTPLHYYALRTAANDNEREPTPAQALGTAFHALILEPELFYKEYCLGIRKSDYPDAVDGSEQLKAMIAKLNEGRLPKLSTTGAKSELVDRIMEVQKLADEGTRMSREELEGLKGAELKAILEGANAGRQGLLSTSGTIEQMATLLRAEGVQFTLWTELKDEWLQNNGHRNVLEPEQWDQLMNMRDAVMAHPIARAVLLKPGKAERSVYWVDPETGELCRCRPDWWTDDDIVLDVKSTEDASLEGFSKSIANFGYDTQDAFYHDGCEAVGRPLRAFLFLACEKTARVVDGKPLGVAVYCLDEAGRELGRAKNRAALATYAECKRTKIWPGYSEKVQTISLPQWHMNRNAHLVEGVA
ncbi:PD-(D/E)XK nuclease-like domain-containing protein [Bradyrhizobium sp. BWC-3-1]|uniref:PD-(D/E)XK nuclease-like domain-containing protein n=1 Tax=Bradyrhizobium sp. BWC-3-1 TaxID=3080012 RepID=UPI00293E608B|nr:PD-(D/E)XK nuclease-like domain-containing protein [Bradyrhizobium sp. BWC-3-1]WOH61951.1 PD-(D/E)XK nuclease-like domain-containing protein [Bradyrhizobium sp. BWC-3-1]